MPQYPTFDIWAPFWPQHSDMWPGVKTATKYEWKPSVFLNGDIAGKITKIKQQEGPDLHVYGSANLVQTLLKHDLGLRRQHRYPPLQKTQGQGSSSPTSGRHSNASVTHRSPDKAKKWSSCRFSVSRTTI
jgi:hypothetical protein